MRPIDHTHDSSATSWVESAQGSEFPIQNLPFCSFSTTCERRLGVGIGDKILDVTAASSLIGDMADVLVSPTLNDVMALPVAKRIALRHRIFELLSDDCAELRDNAELRAKAIVQQSDATFHMPCHVGDYTDFYASVFHATNVGSMFRPNNPLLPNYKHLSLIHISEPTRPERISYAVFRVLDGDC